MCHYANTVIYAKTSILTDIADVTTRDAATHHLCKERYVT